jgi:hypothetical protein
MDEFIKFITSIIPTQRTCSLIKQDTPIHKQDTPVLGQDEFILKLESQFNIPHNVCNDVEIPRNKGDYSLYRSFMYLTCPNYHMIGSIRERKTMIDDFIRFILDKIDRDPIIKNKLKTMNIKISPLIDEIKQSNGHSREVILLLSLIFDVNIIVISDSVQLYHGDSTYDNCKVNIILENDGQSAYNPIIYQHNSLLIYFTHEIVKILVDQT